MRIKRFVTKYADELSDKLDWALEEHGLKPEKKKKPGLIERFKKKLAPVKGPVKPQVGAERTEYLARQLDALLAKTDRKRHPEAAEGFLNQYKQLTPDARTHIMTLLRNYKPVAKQQRTKRDIWED